MSQGWKRYGIGAGGMLALVTAILLATGWSSAVAKQISDVFVTNDSAHPVPVQEQRTDANGNIKVHEQGTANVNVTGGKVDVGTTPIAGDSFATSIIGAAGVPFFRCAGGPIIASTVILSSTQGPARFALKKDVDCSTVLPTGGTEVMNIIVPADSAVAIPLHDRIEVNEVEITCGSGGCQASFDLNGQAG